MPSKASRIIGGTPIKPVYLDKNSELNKDQLNTINTILFNHYRKFRRNTAVVEEDEPLVLKNFSTYYKVIQDVYDRSYGGAHSISFVMSCKELRENSEQAIGEFKETPNILYQAGGTGTTNSEALPGYFFIKGSVLMFKQTAGIRYNDYFKCYLYWMD